MDWRSLEEEEREFEERELEEQRKEQVLKIKLVVDNEKNKVVLAEMGKDFVDVLFSFLVLPMGTIMRLLETYEKLQKSQTTKIGCFNNLYRSFCNIGTDDFVEEPYKYALLYTQSVEGSQCRQLQININENELLTCYKCLKYGSSKAHTHAYGNFCSSRLIDVDIVGTKGNINNKLFVNKNKSFIVTDNMEVRPASVSVTLKILKRLGYADVDKLQEIIIDANSEKVLALLECLFCSDTPLTDALLRNHSSDVMTRIQNMPSLAMQNACKEESNDVLSVTVFVRKHDSKVLFAESDEDFVNLLFTFLALPLESVLELSGSNIALGTFCKNIKRCNEEPYLITHTNIRYWPFVPQPLLDVSVVLKKLKNQCGEGFVEGGQTYIISDDLTITPINPSSTFTMMKKLETDIDDIEDHVIKISETEAVRLLMVSLMTSTALTTALGCLIPKK